MLLSIALFAVAAVFGVIMVTSINRGANPPPAWQAWIHRVFAVAGFGWLVYQVATAPHAGLTRAAAIAFGVAAIGGFFLFSFRLRKKAMPLPVVIVHAMVAVTGFLMLVVSVL